LPKLISKTAMRLFLKQKGKRTAIETFEQAEQTMQNILLKAIARAEKNKRNTVMTQDI